jgi:hypothetical protein
MGKLLLSLSLLALAIVSIGTYLMPNNPMFWLASGAKAYQDIRLVMGSLLVLQLMTNPPRHLWFRIMAGTIALITGIWAIQETYAYHMMLLDTTAFIGASLAVFATALERNVLVASLDKLTNKKASV